MDFEIKKKEKNVKAKEFVKKMYEKAKIVLKKYTNRNRKKVVEYKVENRVLLSTKDLMW